MTTNIESLERLTLAIEAKGVDIAPEYNDYFLVANAIATDCGEAGRTFFHRICQLSAKYKRPDAEKIFDNLLRTNRGEVHLATVFELAKRAGVKLGKSEICTFALTPASNAHARACENTDEAQNENDAEDSFSGSEPLVKLPFFRAYDWPEPLKSIISYGTTPQQKDILLLGAITVLGATLGKKVRISYGGRYLSPCLQTFIVAQPASGKGMLSFLRQFADPVHNKLRFAYLKAFEAYKKEKAVYDNAGRERANMEMPERPVNKLFLIAGNNSGTGILQNIMDADGMALIFELEADTLSTAIGTAYGRFSDTLRKCFDHDRISYNRRTDQEYREAMNTYLSVLISGTPAQVQPLIPSTENGLFSRQLFYYMPAIRQWQNQFDTQEDDLEEAFKKMGTEWGAFLEKHVGTSFFTLKLTDEQKKAFNARFEQLFRHAGLANENEMNSSVVRLAINTCRILSVVAVLRGEMTPAAELPLENVKDGILSRMDVRITPEDFGAVMALVEPLYRHATHILSFLPGTELNRRGNADRDSFFSALPEVFTLQMVRELAQQFEVKPSTATSWVYRLQKAEKLIPTGETGTFRKVL